MYFFGYLSLPYVPNRQNKKRLGRPSTHSYLHRFAYTETMRGLRDDIPTLLFIAPEKLLIDACQYLFDFLYKSGNVGNILIAREHSCRRKNGKIYWRTSVQIINLNEQLISFQEFTQMLLHRMKTICNCTIRHYRLDPFLNL